MGMHCYKRCSVYRQPDEFPLVIYGTTKECANAMGVSHHTFLEYICRIRKGKWKSRKWIICEDEVDEDGNL